MYPGVAEQLEAICERLQHVGTDTTWVYPELLDALVAALESFPVAAVAETVSRRCAG